MAEKASKPSVSVVRNAAYSRGGLNKRERHNERKNADYLNDDIIKERAAYNVHFKMPEGGYEAAFDKLLADGAISTRGLTQDAHIVDELVFDVNTAYFENHGGYDYAKSFFEEAYRLAVQEVGGEQYVLSAVMHADERNKALSEQLGRDVYHYHLHVVYVPVVRKEIYFKKNNKNPELAGQLREVITQVSHSKKWPRFKGENGKWINSYSLLQDRFFEHMQAAGFEDFERGHRGSTIEHLSVLAYKIQQEKERLAAASAELQKQQQALRETGKKAEEKRKQLDALEKKTAVAKRDADVFADVDQMPKPAFFGGNLQVAPADWKTVSNLAKEGIKSRAVIAGLKDTVSKQKTEQNRLTVRLKQYEGGGITDSMGYFQAKARAPRRLAEAVADIMRRPPEQTARARQISTVRSDGFDRQGNS